MAAAELVGGAAGVECSAEGVAGAEGAACNAAGVEPVVANNTAAEDSAADSQAVIPRAQRSAAARRWDHTDMVAAKDSIQEGVRRPACRGLAAEPVRPASVPAAPGPVPEAQAVPVSAAREGPAEQRDPAQEA